jgi:hypothetical protein
VLWAYGWLAVVGACVHGLALAAGVWQVAGV